MRKTDTQKQRNKAVFVLLIVFMMILVTNLIDKNNHTSIQASFESVYSDRLVVDNYIFRISRMIENKRTEVNSLMWNENFEFNNHSYKRIDDLLNKYASTKFTGKESVYFKALNQKIAELKSLEEDLTCAINHEEGSQIIVSLNEKAQFILADLDKLSEIQVVEAEKIFQYSKKLVHSSYLFSQLEMALLIIIAVLIYELVSAKPFRYEVSSRLARLN